MPDIYPRIGYRGRVWVTGVMATPMKIVFSGDLANRDARILRDPIPIEDADILVIESTTAN